MLAPLSALLLGAAAFTSALPAVEQRTVQSLNSAAFAEAQQRDNTATRALSSIEIKTASGQCLFVDELSGDFRANLTPVQIANCNGSPGQKWDIITSGKHDNQPGSMLVVSTLTQACLNFDPRRAAGNQVILFSCGGRADGSGQVTNSQLFPFWGGAGPLTLRPEGGTGICLTVKGNLLDQASCSSGDPNQSFTFSNGAAASVAASTTASTAVTAVTATVTPTVTSSPKISAQNPAPTAVPSQQVLSVDPTTPVPVSRAGGVLNPSAAAEAMTRDNTATRAFSSVSLKSADGRCLFIDPTAGDFRQNLIPVQLKPCDGSANEKFDIITAGKHNNVANSALVVSSLTQGCLNFDPRRAAGDTVILFSCGGRADGQGVVTDSQLFPFTTGQSTIRLAPNNEQGKICLGPNGNLLDSAPCANAASGVFTIA